MGARFVKVCFAGKAHLAVAAVGRIIIAKVKTHFGLLRNFREEVLEGPDRASGEELGEVFIYRERLLGAGDRKIAFEIFTFVPLNGKGYREVGYTSIFVVNIFAVDAEGIAVFESADIAKLHFENLELRILRVVRPELKRAKPLIRSGEQQLIIQPLDCGRGAMLLKNFLHLVHHIMNTPFFIYKI